MSSDVSFNPSMTEFNYSSSSKICGAYLIASTLLLNSNILAKKVDFANSEKCRMLRTRPDISNWGFIFLTCKILFANCIFSWKIKLVLVQQSSWTAWTLLPLVTICYVTTISVHIHWNILRKFSHVFFSFTLCFAMGNKPSNQFCFLRNHSWVWQAANARLASDFRSKIWNREVGISSECWS